MYAAARAFVAMASHSRRGDQGGNTRSNSGNHRSRSGSDDRNRDQGLINLLLQSIPGR